MQRKSFFPRQLKSALLHEFLILHCSLQNTPPWKTQSCWPRKLKRLLVIDNCEKLFNLGIYEGHNKTKKDSWMTSYFLQWILNAQRNKRLSSLQAVYGQTCRLAKVVYCESVGLRESQTPAFCFPAAQKLKQVTKVNCTEFLIECLKQGSIFHCSPHFCRHTESVFVLPVRKDLSFYHKNIHLPFFPWPKYWR